MTAYLQVVTTIAQKEDADRVARALVERRVAACVQVVGPVTSTYRWQGVVETSQEWLCVIKTTRAGYPALEQALLALHPYEVPEILATEITAGHQGYLDWIDSEVEG